MTSDITEREFAQHVNRHKRELHVHCYRMLGSFEEAEDLVQETFLRAWRHRDQFDGGPGFRAWLYRIATNACLDHIRRKGRRAEEVSSFAEIPWLQPYPDRLLDEVAPRGEEPDAVVVARETIELGFLALIQILPARRRTGRGGATRAGTSPARGPRPPRRSRASGSSGRAARACGG